MANTMSSKTNFTVSEIIMSFVAELSVLHGNAATSAIRLFMNGY